MLTLAEIKEKLEKAYNEEDWNIVEELLEALSYEVEVDGEGIYPWHNEDEHEEID
tara:strand:- start:1854 stop:2018 length:165 start_codon:yes stop_codon:yes gene_type:complete